MKHPYIVSLLRVSSIYPVVKATFQESLILISGKVSFRNKRKTIGKHTKEQQWGNELAFVVRPK